MNNLNLKAKTYRMKFFESGLVGGYKDEESSIPYNVYLDEKNFVNIANKFKGAPIIIEHSDLSKENKEIKGYTANIIIENNEASCDFATNDEELINLINQGWGPSPAYKPIYLQNSSGNDNGIDYVGIVIDVDENYPVHIAFVKNPRYSNVKVLQNSLDNKNKTENEKENVLFNNFMNPIKNVISKITNSPLKNSGNEEMKAGNEEMKEEEKKEVVENQNESEDISINKKIIEKLEAMEKTLSMLVKKDEEVHKQVENEDEKTEDERKELEKEKIKNEDEKKEEKDNKEKEDEMIDLYGEKVSKKELYNMYMEKNKKLDNQEDKKEKEEEKEKILNNSLISKTQDVILNFRNKKEEEPLYQPYKKGTI
jgi:hypothetical protein